MSLQEIRRHSDDFGIMLWHYIEIDDGQIIEIDTVVLTVVPTTYSCHQLTISEHKQNIHFLPQSQKLNMNSYHFQPLSS